MSIHLSFWFCINNLIKITFFEFLSHNLLVLSCSCDISVCDANTIFLTTLCNILWGNIAGTLEGDSPHKIVSIVGPPLESLGGVPKFC